MTRDEILTLLLKACDEETILKGEGMIAMSNPDSIWVWDDDNKRVINYGLIAPSDIQTYIVCRDINDKMSYGIIERCDISEFKLPEELPLIEIGIMDNYESWEAFEIEHEKTYT